MRQVFSVPQGHGDVRASGATAGTTPDAAEVLRSQYKSERAMRDLRREVARGSSAAIYNPFSDSARRIHTQAIRPLTARKSLALYLYEMLVMIVVVGTFIAVAWR